MRSADHTGRGEATRAIKINLWIMNEGLIKNCERRAAHLSFKIIIVLGRELYHDKSQLDRSGVSGEARGPPIWPKIEWAIQSLLEYHTLRYSLRDLFRIFNNRLVEDIQFF